LARAWTWALRPGRSATSLAGSGPARGARGRPAGAIQASEDPVHPSGPLAGRRIRWGVQLLHPSVSTLVARATRATRHARSDSGYSRDIRRLSPRSTSRWLRDQGSDQRVCDCRPSWTMCEPPASALGAPESIGDLRSLEVQRTRVRPDPLDAQTGRHAGSDRSQRGECEFASATDAAVLRDQS
jgi:hypothetical protein